MPRSSRSRETAADRDGLGSLPFLGGPSTLGDQLYEILEEAIIEGILRPGQRLHAGELAEHFGISRIPVRESLRALDAHGWIELRPRHGAFVRERSAEELSDLFDVRALLEAESAARAAERRTPEQLEQLEAIVERGRQARSAGDLKRLSRLNNEFHNVIVAAAHNSVLAGVLDGLSKRVRFYFSSVAPTRGNDSVEEHSRLVNALRRRDSQRAARIARAHVETTRTAVQQLLAKSGEL